METAVESSGKIDQIKLQIADNAKEVSSQSQIPNSKIDKIAENANATQEQVKSIQEQGKATQEQMKALQDAVQSQHAQIEQMYASMQLILQKLNP